ncbi:glycosyltransferase [Prochlorothrix hollandica]|uniref:glycosyltransferase n=1 Tax=Prochlorothrix hollandica TaxID=1223 RepID=UPI00333ED7BC
MPLRSRYVFYVEATLPQSAAYLVTATQHANAAANVGHDALLIYLQHGKDALRPWRWFSPFHPQSPTTEIVNVYGLQPQLKVIPLAIPWPFGVGKGRFTNVSSLVCKYYLPWHFLRQTYILQTNNWNAVKAAVRHGTYVIFEQEHYGQTAFDPAIVHSPFFTAAVTLSDPVRTDMLARGMPEDKLLQLHLGFNQRFQQRHATAAATWRNTLLGSHYQSLVLYCGALHRFKGVDLLLDIAPQFPKVAFIFAGGKPDQIHHYRQQAHANGATNANFLGHLGHDRLVSLLQGVDLVLYPHLLNEAATFTSPLKFFEYLASGTPLVSTIIPPLKPFTTESLAAVWAEPSNPAAFQEALAIALQTYPYRSDGYGINIKFSNQFSWENRIKKIRSFADDRITGQNPTPPAGSRKRLNP